jgi:hypothetical protein
MLDSASSGKVENSLGTEGYTSFESHRFFTIGYKCTIFIPDGSFAADLRHFVILVELVYSLYVAN